MGNLNCGRFKCVGSQREPPLKNICYKMLLQKEKTSFKLDGVTSGYPVGQGMVVAYFGFRKVALLEILVLY